MVQVPADQHSVPGLPQASSFVPNQKADSTVSLYSWRNKIMTANKNESNFRIAIMMKFSSLSSSHFSPVYLDVFFNPSFISSTTIISY